MRDAMAEKAPKDARDQAGRALREAIERALPDIGYQEARHMVIEWWKCDQAHRAEQETST